MVNTILIEKRAVPEEVLFLSPLQTNFLTPAKMHKYLCAHRSALSEWQHNHDEENLLSHPSGCFENTMALRGFHLANFFLR